MARTKQSGAGSRLLLENITDGEMVYQRAIIVIGKVSRKEYSAEDDFLSVSGGGCAGATFPIQNWPISQGRYKFMVILSPGSNNITLTHYREGHSLNETTFSLVYVPLLQTPPLHLAIMIAKDSPLLIDCPPSKRGGISSAHSDLDAAIKKLRMTAYMWQALTAEDMRSKGLQRRSFRLEEEWTAETLSREFLQAAYESSGDHMRSTAKVHLIRSDKTVAELRDADVAQQNDCAENKDDLHKYFTSALKAHGSPFESSAHPIVAGLILDSAYSQEQNLILGHAALGNSNPKGISLGMFGSHLTYSWPRFMEEIPSCLLDSAVPGDTVGNDGSQCGSMWEACSIGQGAMLHEVGHAFGCGHTTGIMARGYAQDWPKNFLAKTAYCTWTHQDGQAVIPGETPNNAIWDLKDALSFKFLPHFRLPTDPATSKDAVAQGPSVIVEPEKNEADFLRLVIKSEVQICRIAFNDTVDAEPTLKSPVSKMQFTLDELQTRFKYPEPLKLEVLAMNGKQRIISDVWKLFISSGFIRIPGSSVVLQKRSVVADNFAARGGSEDCWEWAMLLKEKGGDGKVYRATEIDSRVGCLLDGAIVYYEDGHSTPCGPRVSPHGGKHEFGGHAAERFPIPAGVDITKVEVGSEENECGSFNGLRFHMSDGRHGGYLYEDENGPIHTLVPADNERIIGFFGKSSYQGGFCPIEEFGIITVEKSVQLPDSIYDMKELQNTDGGISRGVGSSWD